MAQTTSVLWSVDQGLGEEEQSQARLNIGAASVKSVDDVKSDLSNLTDDVNSHTTQIEQIKEDVEGIESSLTNKKDKQTENTFNGSSTKTVKTITQDVNGELNVEFENIDYPDYNISSSDESINVYTSEGVTDLTLPNDVVRDSNYVHIEGATEVPLKDGNTSVGVSTKYAREDHIHPTDTSREAIANKTTVILGTSNDKYPTDEAVAKFVNSSIATNTANYISNNGNPFTSVEQLNAYIGTVTNNDYAFVNGIDSDGNTYYDRYKATVNGSSVTWSLEYRLNNSSFTAAQWSAINSGITSVLVAKIHEHSNKTVLDGITSDIVSNWNNKMDNQTVGGASEPVYLENGIAKIATGVATKTDLNNLTEVVNGHTTEIGQIKDDVAGIESALSNKKDKQSANTFTGSSTKTIKNISQNANGELSVEFEDIDLSKRVAVNLNQDFTPEEMTTARNNIGASKISYDNVVTDMTVSKEVVRPYMNIKYTATVGNDNFLLMSDAFTDGMVVKSNGSLKTQPIPESGDKFDICQYLLKSIEGNKTVLDKKHISNNYKEYAGNIGFTTTTSGNMSICAFDSNEQLIYPTQCVNFAGPSTGVTNFIPFTFKEEPDKERISYIGIKGASNGNATITHLFYIGKK